MEFVPTDSEGPASDVPYYGETRADDGWQGQGTTRSYDTLKGDVTRAMARLGGVVHGFQRGMYQIGKLERPGVQIRYSIEGPAGKMIYGRIDVAALPVREPKQRGSYRRIKENRHELSLAMALYNVVQALRAQWVLAQFNPGYVPLMAWLLVKGDQTLTQLYSTGASVGRLLPAPRKGKADVVEGNWRESED